jgi:hypothetical protein
MNPYEILELDHRATKAEILRAVARALRLRQHSAYQIAQAQKALLPPVTRSAHEFLCFLDVDVLSRTPRATHAPRRQQPLALLRRLTLLGDDDDTAEDQSLSHHR